MVAFTLLSALVANDIFASAHQYSEKSQVLLEQLQQDIKGTLLAIAENESKEGKSLEDFYFAIDMPASQSTNLGFILDLNDYEQGYNILSVSPGSTAERLSLKQGDRLFGLNKMKLDDKNTKNAIHQLGQITAGQEIDLEIISDGKRKKIHTQVIGQFIPSIKLEIGTFSIDNVTQVTKSDMKTPLSDGGTGQCGRISIFFHPPETKDIYPAMIYKIDDNHRTKNWHGFRLPIGKHTIYLHEYIRNPGFPIHRGGIQRAKPIEINIEANKTYHLGAFFNRKFRLKGARGKYWKPIVWKVSENKCNL